MAAAVAADLPSSAKEDDLPSPSPSPSSSPSPSPSPSPSRSASSPANAAVTSKIPSSPDLDPSSPSKPDLAPSPPGILSSILPSQAAPSVGNHKPSSRRLPPPCWTQEETEALIQSYRDKWYALRRGNLRASHWEEVADAVTRRCRHLYTTAGGNRPKTAVQCRHKMEKLRKRYRSEKRRPHRTSWVHFRDMDAMEMGTAAGAPAAAATSSRSKAVVAVAVPETYSEEDNEEDESDEDEDDEERDDGDDEDGLRNVGNASTRSIHAVMSKAANGVSSIGDLRFQIPKAVRSKAVTPRGEDRSNTLSNAFNPRSYHASGSNGFYKGFSERLVRKPVPSAGEEMRKRLEEKRRKEREGEAVGEMVTAVRMLGDGFMRVEEMKMDMAREMEKLRMEMELKRTEMILETQRWIVDAFVKGLSHGKKKKAKIGSES